jgi:hypothetical protein
MSAVNGEKMMGNIRVVVVVAYRREKWIVQWGGSGREMRKRKWGVGSIPCIFFLIFFARRRVSVNASKRIIVACRVVIFQQRMTTQMQVCVFCA